MSLCEAVKDGDRQKVSALLTSGAIASGDDSDLKLPIHFAAEGGDVEIIKLLIDHGADPNARNRFDGCTVLGLAIQNNRHAATEYLLDHGADMELDCFPDWSVMRAAVHWGHPDTVEMLLQRGATHSERTSQGLQPLHTAAVHGHTAVVDILLRHGADINSQCSMGNTPLMNALQKGKRATAASLMNHGADVSLRNHKGIMAIHYATIFCTGEEVNLLRSKGADLTAKTGHGISALESAAMQGNLSAFTALLDGGAGSSLGDDPTSHDWIQLLNVAAENGSLPVLKVLLERGVQPLERHARMLHVAANNGHTGVVKHLVESGIFDVDVPTSDNTTALMFAAAQGKSETVSALIQCKANTRHTNDDGHQPISMAMRSRDRRCMELLLINGADANQRYGDTGNTIFLTAVMDENMELARLLLVHGADVNLPSNVGIMWTPVSLCGKLGVNIDILSLLLDTRGIDVNSTDFDGRTALWSSAARGHIEHVRRLLSRTPAADVNLKDRFGATPLIAAVRNGHAEVVKLLLAADASLGDVDFLGISALQWAMATGNTEISELLGSKITVANPLPSDTTLLSMPFDPDASACAACERSVPSGMEIHVCDSCRCTRFSVCSDCRGKGATCRGQGHYWEKVSM